MIEVRKLDDKGKGRLALSLLVVGVGGFVHAEFLDKLVLGKVGIFPQIAYTPIIQMLSLLIAYLNILCINTSNDVNKIQQTMYYFYQIQRMLYLIKRKEG